MPFEIRGMFLYNVGVKMYKDVLGKKMNYYYAHKTLQSYNV